MHMPMGKSCVLPCSAQQPHPPHPPQHAETVLSNAVEWMGSEGDRRRASSLRKLSQVGASSNRSSTNSTSIMLGEAVVPAMAGLGGAWVKGVQASDRPALEAVRDLYLWLYRHNYSVSQHAVCWCLNVTLPSYAWTSRTKHAVCSHPKWTRFQRDASADPGFNPHPCASRWRSSLGVMSQRVTQQPSTWRMQVGGGQRLAAHRSASYRIDPYARCPCNMGRLPHGWWLSHCDLPTTCVSSTGYGKQCEDAAPSTFLRSSSRGEWLREGPPCYVVLHLREVGDVRLASVYKPERRRRIMDAGYELVGLVVQGVCAGLDTCTSAGMLWELHVVCWCMHALPMRACWPGSTLPFQHKYQRMTACASCVSRWATLAISSVIWTAPGAPQPLGSCPTPSTTSSEQELFFVHLGHDKIP